MLTSTEDSRVE